MVLRYPGLCWDQVDGKSSITYQSRKGTIGLWGGVVVENVVQALARIIVGEQMIAINDHYRVALTVHDAAVVVVPEDEAEKASKTIVEIMSTAPEWAPDLPVACEAKIGATYGDC